MTFAAKYDFDLIQGEVVVASVSGDNIDDVRREVWHYFHQYIQDGEVIIKARRGDIRAIGLPR